jgi:FkbM family methyltransferase
MTNVGQGIVEYTVGDNYNKFPYSWIYKFRVYKNDTVIPYFLKKGNLFEKYNIMILNSFIKPTDVFIDVGANIGTYSVVVSKMVPKGEVFAFEPFIPTFHLLIQNLIINNCKNVTPLDLAVGYTNKKTTLSGTVKETTGNKNRKQIVTKKISNKKKINYGAIQLGDGGQNTYMVSLDTLGFTKVDVIKVDVEGAEPLVFYGAKKLIREHKPIIIFEHNWQRLSSKLRIPEKVRKFNIIKYCSSLGYNIMIEGVLDTFFLIPPGKKPIKDKLVNFKKVSSSKASNAFKKFKFIKPKW